ncbi:MAG: hypothetical protein ACKO7P_11420, partial [Bacteroidota bacterium]
MNTKKRFLVSALDWGYGHVTRTSVRVEQLAHLGHEIVVACSPSQFHLWKKLHPEISIHAELPENKITLHGSKSDMLSLMLKYRKFKNNWKQEKNWVSEYVQSNSTDAIISDNRYGFYHSDIPTTLITHQLNLQ